jgi:hypothetical protein
MSPADIALTIFALCNSIRVFAYVPQIVTVARDPNGATAISYTTWSLFAASHLSTVAYAVLSLEDWRMAAVFGANTACCGVILGLTAIKRARVRSDGGFEQELRTGSAYGSAGPSMPQTLRERVRAAIPAFGRFAAGSIADAGSGQAPEASTGLPPRVSSRNAITTPRGMAKQESQSPRDTRNGRRRRHRRASGAEPNPLNRLLPSPRSSLLIS